MHGDAIMRKYPMETKAKTIIIDIDGTLVKHTGDICKQYIAPLEVLPGVLDKFRNWDKAGYKIILITGRRESGRAETEKKIIEAGLFFDHLIMGVGGGERILINDLKNDSDEPTARAFTVKRNLGLEGIDI